MTARTQTRRPPARLPASRPELCARTFAALGGRLNEATTARAVAEVILQAADELMGWDSCAFDLYYPESDTARYVLAMDLVGGRRVEVPPAETVAKPTPKFRQVITDGPQMILRNGTAGPAEEFLPFGDQARASGSLLFVPVRCQKRVTGVLTLQKYATYAYTEEDLATLLALANHCGGAVERIQAEARVHQTEGLYQRAIGGAGAVPYIYDYRTKRYSFMGEGIEEITGYKPEEITPELWVRIIQESVMAGEGAGLDKQEAARRVLAGQMLHWRCDMRIVRPDGQSRWVADASIQSLDEAGHPVASMGILEDITERKAVEQSLYRERTMLRTLVDILPDSVYIKDAAGRKTLANRANVLNAGRQSEAEVLGKTDFDLFSREAAEKTTADDQIVLQTGQPVVNREECFPDPQGSERWLLTSKVPLLDEQGQIIGLVGIGHNITERKQAELLSLAISDLSQRLIGAITAEQAARMLAEVADELFGWDAYAFHLYQPEKDQVQPVLYVDTINGQRVDVRAPEFDSRPSTVNRRVIEKGAELTLKPASSIGFDPEASSFGDTSRPSASVMRVPIRLRSETVTGVVSIQSYTPQAYRERDLGTLQTLADCCGVALERIWADEALRQSESQFHLVWDSSEDGMRLTDRDGVILRVNEAYCRMVEKPKAELEGQPFTVVHTPANAEFVLSTYQQRVDTKRLEPRLETQVTLWNGKEVWFELSSSLLERPGQPPLVLCIFRDVTRRKQAAEELERMHRELFDASRQAGMAEVATSVLHNVGNVLNSVTVSSSVVCDKVRQSKLGNLVKAVALLREHAADLGSFLTNDARGRQLPDYLHSLAEHLSVEQGQVLQELKSLAGNIDHIKEIVAMQQSYAKVLGVLEWLPVTELVEDALRLNSGAMERHHVQVLREYSEVPPILVDKHKVLQILVNLVRNAKYALDDRGHADKRLVLRVGVNGSNRVRIAVIDNGIGIAPENLTRIFEHGFTTRKEGHGFGLHNGALAAKDLGGSLTAHSAGPGTGATFTLELPIRGKENASDTRALAKSPPSRNAGLDEAWTPSTPPTASA
ncbi:MAG TPA: PAS domain S-box protein [Candidatus Acidoferrum sp.]|nr:PAS domain S-box protein [Candidatus Acidoferrum sp.]